MEKRSSSALGINDFEVFTISSISDFSTTVGFFRLGVDQNRDGLFVLSLYDSRDDLAAIGNDDLHGVFGVDAVGGIEDFPQGRPNDHLSNA